MSKATTASWKLRNQFSDWLWNQVVKHQWLGWFAAHLLPEYLSDPEAHYWRGRMKEPGFWDKFEPTVGPPSSPWIVRHGNQTTGASTSSTIYLEWRGPR